MMGDKFWSRMLTWYAGKGSEAYLADMWKRRDEHQDHENRRRAESWRVRLALVAPG